MQFFNMDNMDMDMPVAKNQDPLLGVPSKDHSILGSILEPGNSHGILGSMLGPPVFGNSHISQRVQLECHYGIVGPPKNIPYEWFMEVGPPKPYHMNGF